MEWRRLLRNAALIALGAGIAWAGQGSIAQISGAYDMLCELKQVRSWALRCHDIGGELWFLGLASASAAIAVPLCVLAALKLADQGNKNR